MAPFDKTKPFNNLPPLPPQEDLETKVILSKTITASRALAQLNGAIRNLPNPSLFLDSLHLQEAKASSEIENIITTNDDLYKAVVADKKFDNPATKEVINYKEAIWLGLKRLEKKPFITTNLCVEIVQCIKQNTSGIRTSIGTTLSNSKGEIIYTPPSGEDVIRGKMANLEKFINQNDTMDPLIKMAIFHYQFEAIHPFSDGNGRTGRILLLLQLKLEKLLDIPALFLSDYIIKHKEAYYRHLRNVTERNNWTDYILYMLDMVEHTSIQGLNRLESIVSLMETTGIKIKEQLPKVYSKDLVEVLFKLPYTKRQNLLDIGLGTPKTVGNYLIALEEKGFLKSIKVGKEKLYLNHELMKVLGQG
ncbi:Fic family protein [Flagellimonas lutimaris]|uniref:Fic family protein n=1 Tax=Flagellimonas lutimaris TaxID=475082 RepID=A0A3A1N637_9FLAO|nr:Fic/DOC family N-terminal domain-containing protein [Allomuricauda lutimaris]RIV30360.1 Fic family protein [Allomuricauda lutimaris]